MIIRFVLTAADRERLGAPEALDHDLRVCMVDEAIAIQDEAGIDPGDWGAAQQTWFRALRDGFKGLSPADQGLALRAERAMVWLALRHAGIRMPLSELTYNRIGLRVDFPDVEGAEQGKDQSSTPPDDSPTDALS
jgi:hypothetical protein